MKKILILILISLVQNVFSQSKTTDNLSSNPPQEVITEENNSVHNLAGLEIKPEFPGGIDNLQRFIKENYKTPKIVGLKGKVYMTFIIEKDGSLSDIRTTRDLKHGTGEEAIRVLKISPKWIPGKQKGELVRVHYSIAIPINQ